MSSRQKEQTTRARAKARRGRPPTLTEDARRQRILEAAERVFTEIGYGAATMEEIAQVAGMSKRTLYDFFSDKRSLFAALISFVEPYPAEALAENRPNSHEELRSRLLTLAEHALLRRHVEMTRLVIAEARHCPELAEEFHERAMRKGKKYLADTLKSFKDDNPGFAFQDIERTSVALFGAIIGDLHLRALLGEAPASRRVLKSHIESAIELVLPAPHKS
ncbi:TetR/AcrR family transcriptional regulator [Hyphomicrobium sp.]|uniref:TetR/AcrR family transcriptional regulator n=1 Tax=Hyphomicrobium sp. TaxID=82 RepID=UPI0025C51613|nr:TetR/AcrR family transcriptional regulator [Hyphomicrobium sp.]MCC7250765.1 TetR/AcrR family transcriptional regulator [Hyphomicrobium sp.]